MKNICGKILPIIVLAGILNGALGQNSTFFCPTVTKPKVNVTSLSGLFYVHSLLPTILAENAKCGTYFIMAINGVLTYQYTFINNITGKFDIFIGQVLIDRVTGISYLVNNFPFHFVTPYQVAVITDDFRLTFACSECGYFGYNGYKFRPIVLTKDKKPNCIVLGEIEKVLNSLNTTMSELVIHNQDDCNLDC